MSGIPWCDQCAEHNVPMSPFEAWQDDAHRAKHGLLWAFVAPFVPALGRFSGYAAAWTRRAPRHVHDWELTPSIGGWTLCECRECGERGIM